MAELEERGTTWRVAREAPVKAAGRRAHLQKIQQGTALNAGEEAGQRAAVRPGGSGEGSSAAS